MYDRYRKWEEFSTNAARLKRFPHEYDSDFDLIQSRQRNFYRVALLVPLCGSAGLWSPSCIASAQVAVEELNRVNGIDGRQVQLIMIDAALEAPSPVEEIVNELIETDAIDAIVGMHISAIRQRLSKIVRQRVPYVYTPLYEGGESTPGIFAIGETPSAQLGPAIGFLHNRYQINRWALIGNDYVWPRVSHAFAKRKLRSLQAELAFECYVPFGLNDMQPVVERLQLSRADAVLISLVGQDAVEFNRAFGEAELDRQMVRLSCAIEENGLLASGADSLKRLFSSSSYFGGLRTDANAAFLEKYYGLHGEFAPLLNTLGQSIYEGMHFLASLVANHSGNWRGLDHRQALSVSHVSARRRQRRVEGTVHAPMYVARADGIQFEILKRL